MQCIHKFYVRSKQNIALYKWSKSRNTNRKKNTKIQEMSIQRKQAITTGVSFAYFDNKPERHKYVDTTKATNNF